VTPLRPASAQARLSGVTESRASRSKQVAKDAATPAKARAKPTASGSKGAAAATPARPARPASAGRTARTGGSKAMAVPSGPGKPSAHHPNLGLAPTDMIAGHAAAAGKLRANAVRIAAVGLEEAVKADPTLTTRYDQPALRRLLRDGELLVERLSMCLGSGEGRWLADYAEWIGPIYRRRGVPLADLDALCAGIREAATPYLSPDELEVAGHALDGAVAVLRRNSRLAGDRHKRNALWKWLYRGV